MNASPRVMLVIADSSRSGAPEHVLTLATELAASDWLPLVVCPQGPLRERCREAGVASSPLGTEGAALLGAGMRLRQLARRWQPDVVHSHGLRAGMVVRRARPRAAWVHTHHLDGWFTASRLRKGVHRWELRGLGRRADLQVAVSTSVSRFLVDQVGVDQARVRLVHNGIHPLDFRPRTRPAGGRVGVLATLLPSKGVDLAVMALATPGGQNLTLSVGGIGPQLGPLVDLAAGAGVGDRVHFAGEVVERQAFFDGCDLVWVPSRAEPFGLVALEAMSAGVPVVASRVGGLPEILVPPEAGVCVNPADPAALAAASAELLSDPGRYRSLSEAGAERVRKRFSASRMAALTRGVYRELLP